MGSVLLLLVVAGWVVFGVWWFAGHRDGRPVDSIGSFRRQLGTLERRTPGNVVPANRMQHRRPVANASMGRPTAIGRTASPSAQRRQVAEKRRRDILIALIGTAAGSLLLGLIPALHALLVVHLAADGMLAGYIALLVRMRNLAAERDMKVRFLPANRQVGPYAGNGLGYGVKPEPALLRQSGS